MTDGRTSEICNAAYRTQSRTDSRLSDDDRCVTCQCDSLTLCHATPAVSDVDLWQYYTVTDCCQPKISLSYQPGVQTDLMTSEIL